MDVNDEEPIYTLPINRVGVEGIYIPFYTFIGGEKINSILQVNAYIDLPASKRGIHASRSLESIQEVILGYKGRLMRIENISVNISRDLLERHRYSNLSLVDVQGDIVLSVETPGKNKQSLEKLRIYGRGVSLRDGDAIISRRYVGVMVPGITTCPSARRSTSKLLREIPEELSPTHMQRGYLKIVVEEPDGLNIDIIDLIDIAVKSFSSPTFELLKREDEAKMILDAYRKPRFTEDVVRYAAYQLIKMLREYRDLEVIINYTSLESIHDHNLVARIEGRISELSRYLVE